MGDLEALIEKLQNYDIESLPREEDFGKNGFQGAVEPAMKLRNMFRSITIDYLRDMPDEQQSSLNGASTNILNTLEEMRKFDPKTSSVNRSDLVQRLKDYYQQGFHHIIISLIYTQYRTLDLRKAIEEIADVSKEARERVEAAASKLEERGEEAATILENARKAAAEQGVSQQATYFKADADEHRRVAFWWKMATFFLAILILVAAVASLFLHKIPILSPKTLFESYQLIASKLLIFAVLSYMLVLCSRNFMSHKHNSVVNKHRQNALMTFRALADAAADSKLKDVILTHASGCIFSPQETGYTKGSGTFSGSKAVLELVQGVTKGGEH